MYIARISLFYCRLTFMYYRLLYASLYVCWPFSITVFVWNSVCMLAFSITVLVWSSVCMLAFSITVLVWNSVCMLAFCIKLCVYGFLYVLTLQYYCLCMKFCLYVGLYYAQTMQFHVRINSHVWEISFFNVLLCFILLKSKLKS